MTYTELRRQYVKFQALCSQLERYGRVAIAFSGGVDSTFLAAVAKDCLGDRALAITVNAPYMAEWEINEAKSLTDHLGIRHEFTSLPMHESIRNNPQDRCYLCKKLVFSTIEKKAKNSGFATVIDGSNADDVSDYRPGMRALKELGIKSPLLENGISKEEIRQWSKELNLETWNKPAYACLLTRIPYDTVVEAKALKMIEQAEKVLHEMGIRAVRVRKHQMLARLEIHKSEMHKVLDLEVMETISIKLKALGFSQVTLDLSGYEMGSFNKDLKSEENNG